MKKRTDVKPAEAPQKPVVSDKPLIDRYEQERADRSLRNLDWTPEQIAAAFAQAEAKDPYRRFDQPKSAPMKFQKGGGKKKRA